MKIKIRSRRPWLDLNVFLEVRNHISSDLALIYIFIFFTEKNTANVISLPLFPLIFTFLNFLNLQMKVRDLDISLVTWQKDFKNKVEINQNVKLILKIPRRFSF